RAVMSAADSAFRAPGRLRTRRSTPPLNSSQSTGTLSPIIGIAVIAYSSLPDQDEDATLPRAMGERQQLSSSAAAEAAAPLREAWYYAAAGRRLKRGAVLAKVMLGEPLLIGRDRSGVPFALRDICPHRGMPLSAGRFDGQEIECCYHGWRFDS